MNSLLSWLDDRTGLVSVAKEFARWSIPSSQRLRHLLGWLVIFNFLVLLITGLFLSSTYSPSSQTAWESTFYIQHIMTGGWILRGLHHFASGSMVVLLAVFFLKIVFDGAYRAPREVTYLTTLGLILFTMGLAHTGYLLPWDQRGFAAADVFTNIAGSAPVIGPYLQQIIQGGNVKGHQTITRLHFLHVAVFPMLIFIFFVLHVALLKRLRERHPATATVPAKKLIRFWPDQLMTISLSSLVLIGVLFGLVYTFHGAHLFSAADPAEPYSAARPEWYFLFLFRFLRTPIVEHLGLAFGAIHVPTMIAVVILLFPLIGRSKAGYYFNIVFSCVVFAGIIGLTVMTLQEDAASKEYQAAYHQAEKQAERATELALAPAGIPVQGALTLLRTDPLLQGPKIYASRCATCHPWDGHDGLGHPIEGKGVAPDLADFGTREWMKAVLTDFDVLFASTANAKLDGEPIGDAFTGGDMAAWAKDHKDVLLKPENVGDLNALLEFFYAQTGRPDASLTNADLIAKGRDMIEFGELTDGEFETTCIDCHQIQPVGEDKALGSVGTAPVLTRYGSKEWLKAFIAKPGDKAHYGATTNAMPDFETQLSADEMDLLVRWMTQDYYKAKTAEVKAVAAPAE
jgi:ubiquinol-cytochrome c reductase cytochrome b subunit